MPGGIWGTSGANLPGWIAELLACHCHVLSMAGGHVGRDLCLSVCVGRGVGGNLSVAGIAALPLWNMFNPDFLCKYLIYAVL